MSDSYRVRALSRGLRLLAALNARGSASLAELAADTGMAKPTTFRLLQTLLADEYIFRDENSDVYRPAARVSSLSSGFEENAWLIEHVRLHLDELGRELLWPLSVTTLAGLRVLVRINTDSHSPLAVRRLMPGMSLPILNTASGYVFLAFSEPEVRTYLTAALKASTDPADLPARNEIQLARKIAEVRELGFAIMVVSRSVSDLKTLAVPIMLGPRPIAAIAVRFAATAVTEQEIRQRFLPSLRKTAAAIREGLEQDSRAARVFG